MQVALNNIGLPFNPTSASDVTNKHCRFVVETLWHEFCAQGVQGQSNVLSAVKNGPSLKVRVMASKRGCERVLAKLHASVERGNYYEAHQMYRTLCFRYKNLFIVGLETKSYSCSKQGCFQGRIIFLRGCETWWSGGFSSPDSTWSNQVLGTN